MAFFRPRLTLHVLHLVPKAMAPLRHRWPWYDPWRLVFYGLILGAEAVRAAAEHGTVASQDVLDLQTVMGTRAGAMCTVF